MLKDIKLNLKDVIRSPNFSHMFSDEDLDQLGLEVIESFDQDRASRSEWEKRNEASLSLALQVTSTKNFPWPDAANVKFPLLTIASIQYHSRAYPALISGPTPVACRVMAPAPAPMPFPPAPEQAQQILQQAQQKAQQAQQGGQGAQPSDQEKQMVQKAQAEVQQFQQVVQQMKKAAQKDAMEYRAANMKAQRIAEHMSWQILEQDEQWEEEMDKLLLIQAIAGCAFKKTYFDPVSGTNRSDCVSPRDLVVSYYTKNIETSPRTSHIIKLPRNGMKERQLRRIFNEIHGSDDYDGEQTYHSTRLTEALDVGADTRAGVSRNPSDHQTPFELIEQHCWYDFDGDGYAEPYVITVRYDTKQVMRVVARFTQEDIEVDEHDGDARIIRIVPTQYFTKYPFIPSPDGGFYDIGFGSLLGPLNNSIDTVINQLLDAGSMSNAGGGFLGRGFKGKKGDMSFRLGEWKQTDSTGDDLHKSIFPLPVREPSGVLFNLLGLLIQYGQQVAGATDVMQGQSPGQNTPAETSRNTLEQGMKVFNGIYKRTHRAFTQELRKLYTLNKDFLSNESTYFTDKSALKVFKADYSGDAGMVRPAADPFYMSDAQRLNQATAVLQAAHSSPGFDLYEVNREYLVALRHSNIDLILPNPKGPNAITPPPNPKVQVEQMKAQSKQMDGQIKLKMAQMKLSAEHDKVEAEVMKLKADATKALAEAKGVDTGHQIALINAQIGAKKHHQDGILKAMEIMQKAAEGDKNGNAGQQGGME